MNHAPEPELPACCYNIITAQKVKTDQLIELKRVRNVEIAEQKVRINELIESNRAQSVKIAELDKLLTIPNNLVIRCQCCHRSKSNNNNVLIGCTECVSTK